MKNLITLLLLFFFSYVYCQRDTIPLGTKYKEDQFYISISYNQLFQQPDGVSGSGFSYGLNVGVVKDISLSKQGNWALGIGLGYAFDSFNHGMQVLSQNGIDQFTINNVLEENTMSFQSLEVPIELRWRTSNAQKYKFWRIYPGFKFSYNLSNKFSSVSNGTTVKASGLNSFNDLQYGVTLSVGYDAFNFHVYYALSPLFDNATLNSQPIDTRVLRMGLIIYIL